MLFSQNKGSETKYASSKNHILSLRERRVQILLCEGQYLLYVILINSIRVVASEST